MNTRTNLRILMVLAVLILAALACMAPTETPATAVPANTPVVQNNNNNQQPPVGNGETLSQQQKSYLAHATVRIWGVKKQGGKLSPIYVGSGTIITPDGLILTNCHVANPVAMGFPAEEGPDALVIDLIKTEDKPPVSTYLADVLAFDPTLDLAVLRIAQTIKGTAVDSQSLNLPSVPLGDSDQVKFGERLFIFGYPAIGGQTITYSTGDVSGFDSDTPVGDRAWIKTEAAISGGNSGGLASNARGEIIGVPTQIGTGTAVNRVDCRRIQDTNGDGVIDDKDTCIPAGGFINGVRPVNWALPLIEAAKSGSAYTSPYGDPLAENPPAQPNNPKTPSSSDSPQMNLVSWTDQQDDNHCPVNEVKSYPSGTKEILAVFSFSGFTDGETISYSWFLNNKDVADNQTDWSTGRDGNCFAFTLNNGSDPLPDGNYVLKVFAGQPAKVIAQAKTSIGGKPAPQTPSQGTEGGVTLTGTVTDANSGKPLKDILIVVLKPGVDPVEWTKDPQENDIFTGARSGADGTFQVPDPLTRGETYGVVAGNNKMGYPPVTGFLQLDANAKDVYNLDVQLSK